MQAKCSLTMAVFIVGLLDKRSKEKKGSTAEKQGIEECMRRMWNGNGDKLSNQYAGTETNNSGAI